MYKYNAPSVSILNFQRVNHLRSLQSMLGPTPQRCCSTKRQDNAKDLVVPGISIKALVGAVEVKVDSHLRMVPDEACCLLSVHQGFWYFQTPEFKVSGVDIDKNSAKTNSISYLFKFSSTHLVNVTWTCQHLPTNHVLWEKRLVMDGKDPKFWVWRFVQA